MSISIKDFQKFIVQNDLFSSRDRLLVAVSGGVDSVVLVHLLHTLGYDLVIAHCNFQLREGDADKDEDFVCELSAHYKVPFEVKRFDTKEFAEEQHCSIQVAARELRYGWFSVLKKKLNCTKLLTAHHLNDSFETTIYNFLKGTGVNGLKGILPANHQAVRPLLCVTKEQILSYASECKLAWREDASNTANKYKRNLIRNKMIPLMQEVNPGLFDTMRRNQRRFLGAYQLVEKELLHIKEQHCHAAHQVYVIDKIGLGDYTEELKTLLLAELMQPYGFNYSQAESCCDAWQESGKEFFSMSHRLTIDREAIFISEADQSVPSSLEIAGEGTYYRENTTFEVVIKDYSPDILVKDSTIAFLDADKISFPLVIRAWRQGDKFVPLGMRHKKKLSDFMIDVKIPLNLKRGVEIVEDANGSILWIVGHRIDDRFKLSDNTEKIVVMKSSKL